METHEIDHEMETGELQGWCGLWVCGESPGDLGFRDLGFKVQGLWTWGFRACKIQGLGI